MAQEQSSLEKEMEDYAIHGGAIFSEGRKAGFEGHSISTCPYPRDHWKGEAWCHGWQEGSLHRLELTSVSNSE